MSPFEVFVYVTVGIVVVVLALGLFVIAGQDLGDENSGTSPLTKILEATYMLIVVGALFGGVVAGVYALVQAVFG